MRPWILLFLLTALTMGAQELRLQVLSTADLHGHIAPVDTFSLQPAPKGLARVSTVINRLKAQNPHTLLLNLGDSLQGEPLCYVRARLQPELPEPTLSTLGTLGCQASVLGNHDFDWGLPYLRSLEEQTPFPFLAANLVRTDTGKPAFTPYVVLEVGGARVAVLGLCSAPPRPLEGGASGLRVLGPVETARTYLPRLRKDEQADVVIVALHGGLGAHPDRPMDPDQGLALLGGVSGMDLLLLAHSHEVVARKIQGVPVLQPAPQGRGLGVAEFTLQKVGKAWKIAGAEVRTEQITLEIPADPVVLEQTAVLRTLTDRYLDTFVTQLQVDLDGRWSRMEDSTPVRLLHLVQRRAVDAQLSAAASPGLRYFVPKGPINVRQLWPLMPYENRVARIRLTGAQVRLWLEHAARYYVAGHQPDLFSREVPGPNFDTLDGVNYALDISKPMGQRVTRLHWQGKPVQDDQSFTLAINTYRLAGGGAIWPPLASVAIPSG